MMQASLLFPALILWLFICPLLIVAFRIWRPRFAYYWLTGAFSALFAWVTIFLIQPYLPLRLNIGIWQPVEIFPLSPVFIIDPPSWLFALAAITILLAVNLTGMAASSASHEKPMEWMSLAGGAGITCLGLLVMFSANLLTTLLAWALLDTVEFAIYLSLAKDKGESEKAVIKYSTRAAGVVIGVYTAIGTAAQNLPLDYDALSPVTSGLLILAVAVRIGLTPNTPILPFHLPPQQGYAALLRMITTAAHFPLLVKTAQTGAIASIQAFLWIWCGITALLSAISWVSAANSQSGRHYWIIALSSLVVAASMAGRPQAVIAFGWLLLLPGSLVLISSYRNRWETLLFSVGFLSLSSLPFTPGWQSVRLYAGHFHPGWLLLLTAQSLVLAGFIEHCLKKVKPEKSAERWANWIYSWGLSIVTLVTCLMSYWTISGNFSIIGTLPSLLASWPALVVLAIIGPLWLLRQRIPAPIRTILTRLSSTLSFRIILKPAWRFFLWIRKVLLFTSRNLESQSGILWALLILVLLTSLFSQAN